VPAVTGVEGPILTHRSQLVGRLIDFEIEAGAEFIVEMRSGGYSLSAEWGWLPKSAHQYENGIVLISAKVLPAEPQPRLALLPPFPIESESKSSSFDELRKFMSVPRSVGIILLRLGHFAVGIAEDGELTTTKTGSRYVKNQHRKGGQSSNRFRRGREKWIRELFDKAGEISNE